MADAKFHDTSATPKIPSNALVRCSDCDVANASRDVAREAARQWGQNQTSVRDPAEFGKAVATVYLAALVGINEGFEPDSEHPEGRS